MRRPLAAPLLLASFLLAALLWATCAWATTARDLGQRIVIDGSANEWNADERVFGLNMTLKMLEEPTNDSKWGVNNDISQILVTWDAHNLYLAGEAKIWDNNLVIWVDALPGRGMASMSGLNSWSRNFTFDGSDVANDNDLAPDLFGATWDGNPTPHLVIHQIGTQVEDNEVGGGKFQAVSTFYQDRDGRAMELAIPWSVVFANDPETRDSVVTVGGETDTLRWFPPGQRRLKICAAVTAPSDNTGGPDSAPDNTRGHTDASSDKVSLNNFAQIALDLKDDTGLGRGEPDGIPDWGVSPCDRNEPGRFRFRFPVPIVGLRFGLSTLEFSRPAFAPDRGERLDFRFRIEPPVDPSDPLARLGARTVDLTANIFDMRGRFIRNLYVRSKRSAIPSGSFPHDPSRPDSDTWDGRDETGQIVPPGVYVLRLVIEENLSRQTRSVVVVR